MKTLFSTNRFLICLTFLLCLGITAMGYGQAVVSIDPAEVASPAAGGTLSVNVKITNGIGVVGYNVTVGFDVSALQYVAINNGSYLPAGASVSPAQVSANRVTLAATSVSGPASATSGTLATLTFEVVAAKASTIELVEVILPDSAANPLAVTIQDGQVVVGQSLPTDLNNDGIVNALDLTLVANDLGKTGSLASDVNGDGVVNVLDLVHIAQDLGKTTTTAGVGATGDNDANDTVEPFLNSDVDLNNDDDTSNDTDDDDTDDDDDDTDDDDTDDDDDDDDDDDTNDDDDDDTNDDDDDTDDDDNDDD